MSEYRRIYIPGGCHFITVVLNDRSMNRLLVEKIDLLRNAVRKTRLRHPFHIHAWVVLPEHMHCLIELPKGDQDCSLRIRLIKTYFARGIAAVESRSRSRIRAGERGIWQRRFWSRAILDGDDFAAHMNYIHFNPVKHGLVGSVRDWPYSTFHKLVEEGVYPLDWGGGKDDLETPE